MSLDAEMVLCRTNGLRVTLRTGGAISVEAAGGEQELGSHALTILDIFSVPRSVQDGLTKLREQLVSLQEWVVATQTLHDLFQIGALKAHTESDLELGTTTYAFAAAPVHTSMLDDEQRTGLYLAAIRASVRPEDVVVDIGTGTGVLAIAAAKAGARRVYAIEATSIAGAAKAMVAANGVADKVSVIQGWSMQTKLPESATLVISELIGNEPLGELLLESTSDALARFAAPGARFLPSALTICATLFDVADAMEDESFFTERNIARWEARYGLDFSALARLHWAELQRFSVHPKETLPWHKLAPTQSVCVLELGVNNSLRVDESTDICCTETGILSGVLITFRLQLTAGIELATDPDLVGSSGHWRPYVYRLQQPLRVKAGNIVRVSYRYRAEGPPIEVTLITDD